MFPIEQNKQEDHSCRYSFVVIFLRECTHHHDVLFPFETLLPYLWYTLHNNNATFKSTESFEEWCEGIVIEDTICDWYDDSEIAFKKSLSQKNSARAQQ